MAEVLLRHRLRGVADDVHVHSAGLLTEGELATAEGVAVMADRGIDLGAHRSRKLDAELVHGADLRLGMSRRHVAEASLLGPEIWTKAFTLKELVRRGEDVGRRKPHQTLAVWLEDVHWGRSRRDLVGRSSADDIKDPVGRPKPVYERTAAELDALLARVVELIWANPMPSSTTAPGPTAAARWWDE